MYTRMKKNRHHKLYNNHVTFYFYLIYILLSFYDSHLRYNFNTCYVTKSAGVSLVYNLSYEVSNKLQVTLVIYVTYAMPMRYFLTFNT